MYWNWSPTRKEKQIRRIGRDIPYEQDSPPAWTQEAYRPPRSEYSFCCPNGGYPILGPDPDRGYLIPGLDRGGGTPSQVQTGGTPALVRGTWAPPQSGPGQGTPIWTWPGYPPSGPSQGNLPHLDLPRVPPIGTWLGYPPIWTCMGYPQPHNGGQTEKITSRHPSDASGKNSIWTNYLLCRRQKCYYYARKTQVTETPIYVWPIYYILWKTLTAGHFIYERGIYSSECPRSIEWLNCERNPVVFSKRY